MATAGKIAVSSAAVSGTIAFSRAQRRLFVSTATLCIALLAGATEGMAQPSWSGKVEAGSEYDSNIHRYEVAPGSAEEPRGAPVLRSGAQLNMRWSRTSAQRLLLTGTTSAKLYLSEQGQDENVVVTAADARYDWKPSGREMLLSARLSYFDMVDYRLSGVAMLTPRHYATAGAELTALLLGSDEHQMGVHGGYRRFGYKPDERFDWSGGALGSRYRTTIWRGNPEEELDAASLDIRLSYELQRRSYRDNALSNRCFEGGDGLVRCDPEPNTQRRDLYHVAAAELVYTGDRVYSARYQLDVSDSNSFGQSLARHRVELGLTAALPARLVASLKAALQLELFFDSLQGQFAMQPIDSTILDSESRNAVALYLSRDIGEQWAFEVQYAFYSNAFSASELRYRRQTMYLGFVYNYRRP